MRDVVAVRERALWRFLYEIAIRTTKALSINVEDVDLENKRVRPVQGSNLDRLHSRPAVLTSCPS